VRVILSVLFLPLAAWLVSGSFAPFALGGPCNELCESCDRNISVANASTCGVAIYWAEADGRTGCCKDTTIEQCPELTCLWAGTLSVENLSGQNMTVTIPGPGAPVTCIWIANDAWCEKSFGTGANPDITSACGSSETLLIQTLTPGGGGSSCQVTVTFVCAPCPE
jgi:hypothetical protein